MPTDSPRLIPVPRWAVAVVTEHADARAHTPQEARAFEALQAAMDADSCLAPFTPLQIRGASPSTIGALVDALRADMDRLGVASLHAHPVGVDIVLRREG
ncbi:MAG: hypothetical protein ABIL09_23565 [Gemmatimonadota bacterium]